MFQSKASHSSVVQRIDIMSRDYQFEDATNPLTIHVTKIDILNAVPGDSRNCVISRAARREHNCFDVVIFRTVAYVRKRETSVPLRYQISRSAHDTLVAFDASGRSQPITVTLKPPRNAIQLATLRSPAKKKANKISREKTKLRKERLRRAYTKIAPLTLLGVRNGSGKAPC